MLLCSVFFFPWVRPRETVCGLMGRWLDEKGWKRGIAVHTAPVLDTVFHRSTENCAEIAEMEEEARRILYP